VEVEVRQDPRGRDGVVDCGCAYSELQVKIVSAPAGSGIPSGYHVCSVGADSCKQWKSCFWDAKNMQNAPDPRASSLPVGPYPEGNYVLEVYYGGHTADPEHGNYCSDPQCTDSDNTTLGACPTEIFNPPDATCSSGQACVSIDISSLNPSFNSGLSPWTTVYGKPQATTGTYSCAFRSDGSNCKAVGNCAEIRSRDGTNFLAAKNESDGNTQKYKVSLTIPNLTPGLEYIVSVYGWGIDAKMPGESCYPKTRPYMSLESGERKTADYQVAGACQWQQLKLKMIPPTSSSSIKVNLTSVIKKDCSGWFFQSGFDEVSICECPPTPSCTNTRPSAPTLSSPGDGISSRENEILLVWKELGVNDWGLNCAGNNNQYYLYVKSVGEDNPCPDFNSLVSGADFIFSLDGDDDSDSDIFVEKKLSDLSWETKYCWGVRASNGALSADSSIWSFKITYPEAWFQSKGGDVYGQVGISSPIPEACVDSPLCKEYFSLALNGYSGLISSPGSRDFGEGTATESNGNDWSLNGSAQAVLDDYSYNHFSYLVDTACKDGQGSDNSFNPDVKCLYDVTGITTPPAFSSFPVFVYNVEGGYNAITISGSDWNIGNEKVAVFVNFPNPTGSTLNINPKIAVGSSGFFALITNGSMEIKQGTGSPGSIAPLLQGVYIADGQIKTSSDHNQKFIGEGIFYAKNGFALNRDLLVGNATYPAELFIFDPQYLFTAPKVFRDKPYLWREVVP